MAILSSEYEQIMKEYFDVTTVRVIRPNFDNGLTEEQQKHESEVALNNYNFDYKIINNGDESIHDEINGLINWLYERGR